MEGFEEAVSFSVTHTAVKSDEDDARLAEQFVRSTSNDWPSDKSCKTQENDNRAKQGKERIVKQKSSIITPRKQTKTARAREEKLKQLASKGFRFDAEGNIFHGNALIPPQYRALVLDPGVIRTKRDKILERKAKTLQNGENSKQGRFTMHKEKRECYRFFFFSEYLTVHHHSVRL